MAILIVVNAVVLTAHASTSTELQEQRSMTVKTRDTLNSTSKRLETVKEEKVKINSSLREERLKIDKLKGENQSLKVNLQAKKEREAQLASVQTKQVAKANTPAPTVQVSGDKQSWLAASGIPADQWGYVDMIVTRESGWNPNAVNASSGACGLGQQLPCGKWAGAWNDPVAALRAQHGYVNDRYGSYAGAVAFWNANHYY